MQKKRWLIAVSFAVFSMAAHGQAQEQTQQKDQTQQKAQTKEQTRDRVYGSQMMTAEERNQYREQMRNAKTAQERDRIRAEHHKKMQERAKERGMTLPDEPQSRQHQRSDMGPGGGKGGGAGPGK